MCMRAVWGCVKDMQSLENKIVDSMERRKTTMGRREKSGSTTQRDNSDSERELLSSSELDSDECSLS
jgi:hypothetical protein